MGQDDDARSLRRIVLRLLHEDEDEARRELDDIIRAVAEYIGRESSLYTWAVPVILTIPPSLMPASFLVTLFSKTAGNIVYGADRKSTRLTSSQYCASRMPSSDRQKT